jgi:ribosomal protein S12 methylthiotransferase accessory factor
VIAAALDPRLRRALSPETGIVHALEECLASSAEPRLFRVACDVRGGDALVGTTLAHCTGIGGAGRTRAEAAAAAVGEALERYAASYVPRDRLVVASARELGERAVAPERFALFSDVQYAKRGFPFRRFDADTRLAWTEATSLPGGEPAWVPAELVYLGDARVGNRPIGYATSSGAACAPTHRESLERGLCELLERDAFMIVWSGRLSLPLLDWHADPELAELDRVYFAATGLAYTAVDLSSFHALPSVLGVVRAPRGTPGALGVGAGTAASVGRAWFKALSEAFAARAAGAKLQLLPHHAYGASGEGVGSFEDHIRYYADERRAQAASFLDASDERTRVSDVPTLVGDHLAALCRRVAAAGSSAYAVDVTSPDVADLGLVVTKVVAPELCGLDVAHGARFLGGRRLYQAAVAQGLAERTLDEADVNPHPHPFP